MKEQKPMGTSALFAQHIQALRREAISLSGARIRSRLSMGGTRSSSLQVSRSDRLVIGYTGTKGENPDTDKADPNGLLRQLSTLPP